MKLQTRAASKSSGIGRRWNHPTSKQQALRLIRQRSQQWLRWFDELENAKGISLATLPDDVQTRLKAVVREIRKLETVTTNTA